MDSERPGVKIHLDSFEYLRKITSLMLNRQHFSFSSNSYVMFQGMMIDSLTYLQTLSLGIDMGNPDQSWALIGLLNRTPKLLRLKVWRTDTPSDDEGEPWTMDRDPLVCRCVADYRDSLIVTNYRGGKAEQEFVKAVLRRSCKLTTVIVNSHMTLPQHIRKADYHLLINSERAIAVCSVNVF